MIDGGMRRPDGDVVGVRRKTISIPEETMTNTAMLHPALDPHERLSDLELMMSEEMQGVDGGCALPGRDCDLFHRLIDMIRGAIKQMITS